MKKNTGSVGAFEALEPRQMLSVGFIAPEDVGGSIAAGRAFGASAYSQAEAIDVNRDGFEDFVTLETRPNGTEFVLRLWMNDGAGNFAGGSADIGIGITPGWSWTPPSPDIDTVPVLRAQSAVIGVADIDGDGYEDIWSTTGKVLWNNAGTLSAPSDLAALAGSTSRAFADVNSDGKLDLFTMLYDGDQTNWLNGFVNEGGRSFRNTYWMPYAQNSEIVHAGRITLDSSPDLVVRAPNYYTPGRTYQHIYKDPSATSLGQLTAMPENAEYQNLTFGDLNGDGIDEAIYGQATEGGGYPYFGNSDGNVVVLRSTSEALFQDMFTSPVGAYGSFEIIDDVNGDDRPDLLLNNIVSYPWYYQTIPPSVGERLVIESGPNFAFQKGAQVGSRYAYSGPILGQVEAMAFGDIDGDGDADALLNYFGWNGGSEFTKLQTGLAAAAGAAVTAVSGTDSLLALNFLTEVRVSVGTSVDGTVLSNVRVVRDRNGNGVADRFEAEIGRGSVVNSDGTVTVSLVDSNDYIEYGLPGPTFGEIKLIAIASTEAGFGNSFSFTMERGVRQFMPEGFRNVANVNETVTLANPLGFDVKYRVVLRYETGERDQVFSSGVLGANQRLDLTLAARGQQTSVREGVPYAVEVVSSQRIGASMTRFDAFGSSVTRPGGSESFTEETSSIWSFTGLSSRTQDFISIFNTSGFRYDILADRIWAGTVTVTIGNSFGVTKTQNLLIDSGRRGSVSVRELWGNNSTDALWATVVSNGAGNLVASASSHNPSTGRSDLSMGETDAGFSIALGSQINTDPNFTGARFLGTVPVLGGVSGEVLLTGNVGDSTRQVTIVRYLDGNPARSITNTVTLRAGVTTSFNALGGISGAKSVSVVVLNADLFAASLRLKDANQSNATAVASPTRTAGSSWLFTNASLDRARIGTTSLETLSIFNSKTVAANVNVTYTLANGQTFTREVVVGGRSAKSIDLHNDSWLRSQSVIGAYTIKVQTIGVSNDLLPPQGGPISVNLIHVDRNRGSFWSSDGTMVGRASPLYEFEGAMPFA
jgi:hypothetical protein